MRGFVLWPVFGLSLGTNRYGRTVAGAEWGRAGSLVAAQSILDVGGVVGAALLAVVDDVDSRLRLLCHDLVYGALYGGAQLIGPRLAIFPRQQQIDHP